jgi:predicted DNA-binding transcriptional regulator AlpA
MTRLLSKRQVAEMTGFHPEHIMRLARNDHFPRPIKTGDSANCAVRFVETDVEGWIEARRCERDADRMLDGGRQEAAA